MIHNVFLNQVCDKRNQTVVLEAFIVNHLFDPLINFRPEVLVLISEADFLYLQIVMIIFFLVSITSLLFLNLVLRDIIG